MRTEKQRELTEGLNDFSRPLLANSDTVPQIECDPFDALLISQIALYFCAVILRCVIPIVYRKTNGEVNFSHETQLC